MYIYINIHIHIRIPVYVFVYKDQFPDDGVSGGLARARALSMIALEIDKEIPS